MHKSILALILAISFFPAKAMKVALDGEFLAIESRLEGCHSIRYEFSRCMANHIYTFSRVLVDSVVVNEATSDNIGPFLIENSGWTGGNHLLPDGSPSARTDSISIHNERGERLGDGFRGDAECVTIRVVNTLLNPLEPDKKFCTETICYSVCGNSIQVCATHSYVNVNPLKISRYYGMQSMMVGETEILTPGGKYSRWTPVDSVDRFTRKSAPQFHQFIEKSDVCHAAAYMTGKGIGDRHLVAPDDFVFIGNSWSKSYHKLIGDATVKNGDKTQWEGIYTWFISPLYSNPEYFSYLGCMNGRRAIFCHKKTTDHITYCKQ